MSHWIHEALKTPEHLENPEDLQLLLVERCSTRFKAGTKIQTVVTTKKPKAPRSILSQPVLFRVTSPLSSILVYSDKEVGPCLDTNPSLFPSVLVQVDGKHQDAGVAFERLQVDIEHLDLSKRGLEALLVSVRSSGLT